MNKRKQEDNRWRSEGSRNGGDLKGEKYLDTNETRTSIHKTTERSPLSAKGRAKKSRRAGTMTNKPN
jgi:hypothetical protein